MDALKIQYLEVDALKPRRSNPRTHSPKQIGQIADSIKQFGFTNPVLVDESAEVIAGHGRLAAAKQLGLKEVPTIRLDQLSEVEIRAYVIADNRLAENAGWDRELLGLELQELMNLDLDFEVEITGFETAEIDLLIEELNPADSDPDDDLPELEEGPPVTQVGDLWQIGPHRLICGDALDPSVYERLLGNERAQCIFTDPPFNVPIGGHVSGLGQVKHREFAMASGEMTAAEFEGFLECALKNLANVSVDGAIHFVCMDWRHLNELLAAGRSVYSELKNLCVWAKTNGGMGSLYRSQHELVFVYKVGRARHINNIELGRYGRYRTNVWSYPGVNAFGEGRDEALEAHPTVKPVALVADAILDCSKPGGIVLDAFAGSGTTILAAERKRRRGFGIELDPRYCDVILKRLAAAGVPAVLAETDQSYDEVATVRRQGESTGETA